MKIGLLPLLLACGEKETEEEWLNLTVRILSHESDDNVYIGYPEQLEAEIEEIRGDSVEGIEVSWFVGEEELACDWTDQLEVPDATNRALVHSGCEITPEQTEQSIWIKIRKDGIEIKQQEVLLNIQEAIPPAIEIQNPVDGEMIEPETSISFQAQLQLDEGLARHYSLVDYRWSSDQDGLLHSGYFSTAGEANFSSSDLSSGAHEISLVVTAPDGQAGEAQPINIVINALPEIENIELLPENPEADSAVSCLADIEDPDGETPTLSYSWRINGEQPIATGEMLQLTPQLVSVGDEITCEISALDGSGQAAQSSISTNIINTAPIFITETAISPAAPVYANTELSCSASSSDLNDGELIPEYIWMNETTLTQLGTGATLSLNNTLVAPLDSISCTATVEDNHGAIIDSISVVNIANSPPVIDTPSISPNTGIFVGTQLSCAATAFDTDDGSLSPDYAWQVNGAQIATGSVYTISAMDVDVGDSLQCMVTVADSHGAAVGEQVSVIVENSLPQFTENAAISPATGIFTGTSLFCAAAGLDADDGSLIPEYEWFVSGNSLGTGPAYTVDALATDVGDTIECVGTIEDSSGEALSTAASVLIENTPPVLDTPVITPNTGVYNDSSLSCSANLTDPDEGLGVAYTWEQNGSFLGSGDSINLGDYSILPMDEISCVGSATDSQGASALQSSMIIIENREPILTAPILSNGNPEANEEVFCFSAVSDDDGQALTPSYSWDLDGIFMGSGDSIQLDPLTALVGSDLTCVVSVDDGYGGSSVESVSATIANTAPTITDIVITPDNGVYTGTMLNCLAQGDDLNDGSLAPEYEWSVSGNIIGTGASYLVDMADTSVGDLILCTATVTDANNETSDITASVLLENSAPTLSDIGISSPSGFYYNDELLTCSASIDDVDEIPNISYEWVSGGNLLGDAPDLDLASLSLMPSDSLSCTITVEDSLSEQVSDSIELEIGDRAPTPANISIDWGGSSTLPHDVNDLFCVASGSIDPDGESVSYSYEWSSDFGQVFSGDLLSGDSTIPTEIWTCTARAIAGALETEATMDIAIGSENWADCPAELSTDEASFSLLGENSGDGAGEVYATGDVDGDGIDDILIGVWQNDDVATNAGKVYLFLGASLQAELNSSSALSLASADYVFLGETAGDEAGSMVTIVPDVDGDSLSDILIGADKNQDGGANAGKIYLIFGSSLGTSTEISLADADYRFLGETGARLGEHISFSDVDGDGLSDLLFGAPYYDAFSGKAYLILASSLGSANQLLLGSDSDYLFQGSGLSDYWIGDISGGDFDGDGLGDILIGAPQITGTGAGKAYLFFGASLGSTASISIENADVIFAGEGSGDYAGHDVRGAGDLDGDGKDELLISAVRNPDGGTKGGKIYLIMGSSLQGISSLDLGLADYRFIGENANDEAGRSISGAGDVDGDSIPDILIGAPYNDDGGNNAGKAYLFSGFSILMNPSGTEFGLGEADYSFLGAGSDYQLGLVDLVSGDINGDGIQDTLVGATGNDELGLYLGCGFINDAPTPPDVQISWTSGGPYAEDGDDLSCLATGSIDPDGGTISYTYSWMSSSGATVSGPTVLGTETSPDERWTCTVLASDGAESTMVSQDVSIYTSFWENCAPAQQISGGAYHFLGEGSDDQAGYDVSSAGDVDGDGLDDILISALEYDSYAGRVYLVLGSSLQASSSIDLSTADYIFTAENSGDHLGSSVSSAGDVDGDGLSDILIGASHQALGGLDAGKVYLVLGSTITGHNSSVFNIAAADHSFLGLTAEGYLGNHVEGVGDVDGDGLSDILLGADGADNQAGRSYLFFGSSLVNGTILDSSADHIFLGEAALDYSGFDFTGADVDGDGLSDILISAPYNDDIGTNAGKAYLILGSSLNPSQTSISLADADYIFLGEDSDNYAGYSVSIATNLDGDQYGDILLSASRNDDGGINAGKAYVILGSSILGSSSLINLSEADYALVGEEGYDSAGHSLEAVLDADGDGLSDILVGAQNADSGGSNSGKAYLILGSSILNSSSEIDLSDADYSFAGENIEDELGAALYGLGDFTGDGRGDILIGARYADSNGSNSGSVGLFSACE